MSVALELKGVTKRFGALVANNSIDLTVKKGSIHAVIGENGAGKSTLMNIIAGIHKMDAGEILLNGKPVIFHSANDASRHGIGMVHQEFMLFPELSVLENIIMGFECRKGGIFLDKKAARKKIQDICDKYHFSIPLDKPVQGQPVAMLQQIEIVKVLYQGAEIIIFDEPTSVLTPQGVDGLFDAMRYLNKMGKTILFITHKLKEVLTISEEITILRDGQVVGNTTARETTGAKLASMMVGREVILNAIRTPKKIGDEILSVQSLLLRDAASKEKLKNVSFSVRAGEIVGIAGVAGSGQLELVEALYGLAVPEGGSILFRGEDITRKTCRQRRCLGIGLVPQNRMTDGVNPKASIWENAVMGYHIAHGFSNKWILDKRRALEFTHRVVTDFSVKTGSLDAKVASLSGGNVQKLIVGREFLQENRLLIIVDPTRGIDIGTIEFIWKKIGELASTGVGVLLVSHELNEIMEVSDRILVMYDGDLYDGGLHGEKNEHEIGLLMTGGTHHAE